VGRTALENKSKKRRWVERDGKIGKMRGKERIRGISREGERRVGGKQHCLF